MHMSINITVADLVLLILYMHTVLVMVFQWKLNMLNIYTTRVYSYLCPSIRALSQVKLLS